jgi:iron complex transport system substrate-binding protein
MACSRCLQRAIHEQSRLIVAVTIVMLIPLFALAGESPVRVRRIVSLAPSMTETVFALGAGDRLVGVSLYCDYPPEAKKIDRVGTFLTPNVEVIVAKRPDVVLAAPSPGNRNSVESLRRLGLRVLVAEPHSVEEVEESILKVGRTIGKEGSARRLVADIEKRIARVTARTSGVERRKVLMVIGQMPLRAVGTGTFLDELIRMAGGQNLAAAAGGPWPHVSIEFVLVAKPEVIIDTTMGNEEHAGAGSAMAFWNAFSTIPAVKEGRVYGHKQYHLLRPGPRVAEALETIARYVQPESFR